ncbi:LysR family transcriptional regulator [Novosphingobium album (ex Hu et al. 2023)]|uniref:LysR substrate-binding domain-containing protein n=1 Tax=Novosphingobium album (ex Hu et al. 2023) TaxID=2930093 RepID=A0ABT0B7C9_9SPHN|nr:LysR family transcriptional regulator [Novosphingobium album (ex Hu et al. 2023)]MCJ2180719.1 LysR substrate-binding domain-containing protein [Novosphingobium album (ex Hu et al. 2023)]
MEIWQFNLRHLKAAAKIVELGTVNAAADAVNLSQPAITQALGRLEKQLGVILFERRFDGMVPTEAAILLAPRIDAAMGQLNGSHVTMSRLRALLTLADQGSYAGASQMSGLSLPSIHRAVADLSTAMRRKLVERRGKIVALTEAGYAVVRAFRLARVELEMGLSEVEALKGRETRSIAVGAMPLSRARVLPGAVARFIRNHPKVRLRIAEGSRAELLEPLRQGVLDLMIGALRDPLMEEDLIQTALFEDLPAIYGRAGHPLAGKAPSAEDLARYDWVVPQRGAPLRDSFERFFERAGSALPLVPIESGSVMMVRQLLMDSDFLTLLSPDQVAVEMEAGWLVQLARLPPGLGRTIGMTWRASWRPTAVQRDFIDDLCAASEVVPGFKHANLSHIRSMN